MAERGRPLLYTREERRQRHLEKAKKRNARATFLRRKKKADAFWATKTEEERQQMRWAYCSGPDTLAGYDDL